MSEQPEQRIAVIGSPGGGKSTIATALARATGLPLFHLDREHWRPGWVAPDADEWRAAIERLAAQSVWVIDGNYASTLPIRLARATAAIWLDLPTRICLTGAIRRSVRHRGAGRPDMGEGCPERLDRAYLKFLHYIATFRRRHRPDIVRALAQSGLPVIHIASVRERGAALRAMADGAHGVARLASSRLEIP